MKIIIRLCSVLSFVMCVLAVFMSMLCFLAVEWLFHTWNHLTVEELQFHLQAPLQGVGQSMVMAFVRSCAAPAAVVAVVSAVILLIPLFRNKKSLSSLIKVLMVIYSLGVTGLSGLQLWDKLDFTSYLDNQSQYSKLIDHYYVDPETVSIQFPEQKRNLVYIYLESMETTFSDQVNGGGFTENYIPELTALAQQYEDFSGQESELNGAYELPGTGFTMGSIFGQTAGLPVKVSFDINLLKSDGYIFPDVVTLGDILLEEGYRQIFILGSDASFASKDSYFKRHGDFEILDYTNALEQQMIPEDYKVWWGYEDRKTFEFAKEKIKECVQNDQPFHITILTVDTHFEDGYVCPLCQNNWEGNQYANVISCSSRQTANFVRWIQKQDFYENTTVVLIGDHLTMDTDFCERIDSSCIRRSYTAFINAALTVDSSEKREYTVLDLFPTTLAALGAEIEDNRLGLGTNLFSYEQTLTERFGLDTVRKELEKKSLFMENINILETE